MDLDSICFWLDFGLIWVGFGLILVGFGSICFGFWSIIAPTALVALWEVLGSSLGEVTKVTRATEVIKCIIEYEIDHLAP